MKHHTACAHEQETRKQEKEEEATRKNKREEHENGTLSIGNPPSDTREHGGRSTTLRQASMFYDMLLV